MRFPGIIPAVTTPFDANGAVDTAGLAANVRFLLDAGRPRRSSAPARWARRAASTPPSAGSCSRPSRRRSTARSR